MPLAISYVRFSHPSQRLGRSKERQIEDCERYCADHGLTLAKDRELTFFDAGRSAFKGEHLDDKGELRRFLDLVENGTIPSGTTLIIESLDRLSRQDVWTALSVLGGIVDSGIRVVTLRDRQVYDDMKDERKLISFIFDASRAHSESTHKSDRLQDAYRKKREAAANKTAFTKQVPMWLRLRDDRSGYDLVPEHVETVRMIFDLAITYGKNKVAWMLNEQYHRPTFKPNVKGWGTSAVSHVLKNRAVLGEFQPMSKLGDAERKKRSPVGAAIRNYFPPIISEETFARAYGAVSARRVAKATKQSAKINVWQGVGKCIHCGSAMHMVNKGRPPKGQTYIECSIGRKGLCESHRLIRLDHSEQVFRAILARLPALPLVRDSGGKLAKDLQAIDGRIAEQQAKLDKAVAAFTAAPSTDIAQIISGMRATLTQLTTDRVQVQGELAAEDAIDFDTFMQRLDLESPEGRAAANALLKRLDVLVFASREDDENRNASSHYVVSQDGQMRFGVSYVGGKVGYRELSPWKTHKAKPDAPLHEAAAKALKHASKPHYGTPIQAGAGAFSVEEDYDQHQYDS